MPKKDFSKNIKNQMELKSDSQKQDTIAELKKDKEQLLEKIKEFESKKDLTDSVKIPIDQIIEIDNIREIDLEHDDIENLAKDIEKFGQLQPVLLTKDNHLIAGYRRYNAVKYLVHPKLEFLYALRLDKNFSEINPDLIDQMQFSENENRRPLDNFQLAKLFSEHQKKGKNQKQIAETFLKAKGFVSNILAINKIDKKLVNFIKEFQIYAFSKEKYTEVYSEGDIEQNKFYQSNKGIMGWKPLYSIAKHNDLNKQKEIFLKLFGNRLSDNELNYEYFKDVAKDFKKDDKVKLKDFIKNIKSVSEMISEIKNNISNEDLKKIEKNLTNIENILIKNSDNF